MKRDLKKTILVVDDLPQNLDILKQILSPTYNVKVAINGKIALKIAYSYPPDLILLDIMMPEMDGYEVCSQLKTNSVTAAIPIIFVTAKNEIADEAKGFDAGAVDYISKPISAPILLRRVATHLSLVRIEELNELANTSIHMLGAAAHYHDDNTGMHVYRMASYSRAIATTLGWSEKELDDLELAALLHDTGKLGIPDSILKAPRALTNEEWSIMKTHPQIGYDILSKSSHTVFKLAAEIALNHHERWDGNGYPKGLKGEEIPESARIVSVADVFDALTSSRPYKEGWPVDKAIAEIKKLSGIFFEPKIVDAFLSCADEIINIKKKMS